MKSNSFEFEVKNVKINLPVEKLGEPLEAPTEGAEKLDDRPNGLRLLLGRDDVLDFEEILAKHLFAEHYLLHHITCKILIPRIERFDFVTRTDVASCIMC